MVSEDGHFPEQVFLGLMANSEGVYIEGRLVRILTKTLLPHILHFF